MTTPLRDAAPDRPKKQRPDLRFPGSMAGDWTECPACHASAAATGLWCTQCWGYGWVRPGSLDATCLHDFEERRHTGIHEYRLICRTCDRTHFVDSSG